MLSCSVLTSPQWNGPLNPGPRHNVLLYETILYMILSCTMRSDPIRYKHNAPSTARELQVPRPGQGGTSNTGPYICMYKNRYIIYIY